MSASATYLVYNTETGKIRGVGVCPFDDLALQAQEGEAVIEVDEFVDCSTNYIKDGSVTSKASLGAAWSAESVVADGTSEIALSGLPIPCTVYVNDQAINVDDGSLEFSTSDIGYHRVMIDEPEYLRQEWLINAV